MPLHYSILLLLSLADASLKLDETLEEIKEDKSEESERSKATRHQSMVRSHRRRRNHPSSTPSSRRHTTGISFFSTSTPSIDTYDISSLDQRDLRERGLSVWQLSPAEGTGTPKETVDNDKAHPSSVVMSSKMQSTAAAALTGHQTGTSEIIYTKVTIGPRNAALPWKPMELSKRLEIFNGNDFGLYAKMVSVIVIELSFELLSLLNEVDLLYYREVNFILYGFDIHYSLFSFNNSVK